jgi:phosphoribosylamine--glycine ligase
MTCRRFLFVSADVALITDLAWQVNREGHDVTYYIEADSGREIGDGFVPKTDDWRAEIEWADVVVFDDIRVAAPDRREGAGMDERGEAPRVRADIGTGQLAQEFREQATAVVGGTPNTDRLDAERGYAMELLEDRGVDTIEHHIFEDVLDGIRHVREHPAPSVIKRLGEVLDIKRLM